MCGGFTLSLGNLDEELAALVKPICLGCTKCPVCQKIAQANALAEKKPAEKPDAKEAD